MPLKLVAIATEQSYGATHVKHLLRIYKYQTTRTKITKLKGKLITVTSRKAKQSKQDLMTTTKDKS